MVKPSFPVAFEGRTPASLEAEFTRAVTTPGLCSSGGREWEALFPRFARYYERLTRLPRRTRRALQRQWKQSLSVLALLLALGQAPALAATINVNINDPNLSADGQCALIEAIENANDNTTGSVHTDCTAGTPAGPDTIDFVGAAAGSTHTLTAVHNSTLGATGLPLISSTITIEGRGSAITRDGSAPAFRILTVNNTGNLTSRKPR